MLRLSPCAEIIFRELEFTDRIDAYAKMGFSACEFWGWKNKDMEGILRKIEKNRMKISSFGIDPSLQIVDPKNKGAFVKAVEETITAAKKLSVTTLIVTTGKEMAGVPRQAQHESIVNSLKAAAPAAESAGVTLVLEPLNILVDHKGYYLSTSLEGFQVIKETGSKSVKLLYDIYHQQITEGNIIQNVAENIGLIGHFHSADVPGRHELGTGELNYRNIIQKIKETGFSGYIGLEFLPLKPSKEALQSCIDAGKGVCD